MEAGATKTVCFDKTGTLTELDIKSFGYMIREGKNFESFGGNLEVFEGFELFPELLKTLSLCHSLEIIDEKILGDPLEISMFEGTESKLSSCVHPYDKEQITNQIKINKKYKDLLKLNDEQKFIFLKVLDFDSTRKRMSVITEST